MKKFIIPIAIACLSFNNVSAEEHSHSHSKKPLSETAKKAIELKQSQSKTPLTENEMSRIADHADQKGEMVFWSDSIALSGLFQIVADFAEKELKFDPSKDQKVTANYREKTHWKDIATGLGKQHKLDVVITDDAIIVK